MTFQALFDAYCRIEDRRERFQFAFRWPALLSSQRLPDLKKTIDQGTEEDKAFQEERLAELDSLRIYMAQDAGRYPAGAGPVEHAAKRVADGEMSLTAALAEMRRPELAMHLGPLYVHLLIWHAQTRAMGGDAPTGALWARLLAEACLAANPAGTVSEQLEIAGIGWIQIAGVALGPMPDGEILASATTLGQELLDRLAAAGDLRRQANVYHAMGSLYSDPFTSSTGAGTGSVSRTGWLQQLAAKMGTALADSHLRKYPLPRCEEALAKAIDFFQRALPNREGVHRGITLKAMAQTLVHSARSKNEPIDVARVGALCTEALQLLPPDNYHRGTVIGMLHSLGLPAEPQPLTARALDTPDDVLQHAAALAQDEPAAALHILSDAEGMFERSASESQRSKRFSSMLHLLAASHDAVLKSTAEGSVGSMLASVREKARAENWNADRLSAGLISLALATGRTNEEELGLRLLQAATEQSAAIAAYHAPIAFLYAQLSLGAAVNALDSGDPVTAVQRYAQALAPNVRLQLHAQAMELLERIADLAKTPVDDMAFTVLVALAPVAAEIDRELGAAGTEALQWIYQNTLASIGDSVNSATMGMLMQLAKGTRFSAMLREGVGFDWGQDKAVADLSRKIDALQRRIDRPDEIRPLDEVLLVSAVSWLQATDGGSPEEQLINLQQAFERRVVNGMTAAARQDAILRPEIIQQRLGRRSVLLDFFFGKVGEADRAMFITVYTNETIMGFKNPLVGDQRGMVIDAEASAALVDSVGLRTLRLRGALQKDPGGSPMHPDAQAALEDDFELLLGTPTWDYLKGLRRAGKDHLCIRPHGALRYYPMPLLGTGGRDLAQDWIVTSIPSLEHLLPRGNPPARPVHGQALGLTYAGGKPFGLPELYGARSEVESVARVFGTPPLLDAAVTEACVLKALQSASRVHLCAHGAHNAGSPLFQHIFVTPDGEADGRLCAYQILGHDLSGLDILSLGVCDSALGRFDAGDNLTGLPAALLAAGTASIVAALWEISDDAAALFFVRFYEALEGGDDRLDAFRTAQVEVREAFPQARDWAAFCFLGAWCPEVSNVLPPEDLYINLS